MEVFLWLPQLLLHSLPLSVRHRSVDLPRERALKPMFTKSPRCQIVPLPNHEVAFGIDGNERLRWHASPTAPRPFFFPLIGPSGLPLTRMGHPGAPNHDHHRSIWFAHHKVLGIDFWSDNTDARIRQTEWMCYEDGDNACRMAVTLGWYDGHDPTPLIDQQVIVSLGPDEGAGVLLEIQTELKSTAATIELQQTNFGLFAVRVAAAISGTFGDGVISGANGQVGEKNLFGKPNPWMDYSGSIDENVTEGITYFDHASNPTFPSKWHVRTDGWMGASICRDEPVILSKGEPTIWRYMLHAHAGPVDSKTADQLATHFNNLPRWRVRRSPKPHHQFEIVN